MPNFIGMAGFHSACINGFSGEVCLHSVQDQKTHLLSNFVVHLPFGQIPRSEGFFGSEILK